jgi:hypothetical protein
VKNTFQRAVIHLFTKLKNLQQIIYKRSNHDAAEKAYGGGIENTKG